PRGLEDPLVLEAVKRRIQGALRHAEASAGDDVEAMDEGVSVQRFVGDGAHEQHVQRALKEVGFRHGYLVILPVIGSVTRYDTWRTRSVRGREWKGREGE